MMKRLSLILMLLSLIVVQQVHAQYYSCLLYTSDAADE